MQFIEKLLQPVDGSLTYGVANEQLAPPRPHSAARRNTNASFSPSSLPPPSSFPTSFFPSTPAPQSSYTRVRSTSATFLPASSPSTPVSGSPTSTVPVPLRTRPAKILIYSADGYTESSVLALCILMALRQCSLPEAYLTLQVEKRRSFFVYQSDLGVLRRVEARLEKDRAVQNQPHIHRSLHPAPSGQSQADAATWSRSLGHASAKSVSFVLPSSLNGSAEAANGTNLATAVVHPLRTRSESDADVGLPTPTPGRPRAQTMPPSRLPPWNDHQVWFNDPRFDGSFPSRVLPFLYLGNL